MNTRVHRVSYCRASFHASSSQARMNATPPNGVIAPSVRTPRHRQHVQAAGEDQDPRQQQPAHRLAPDSRKRAGPAAAARRSACPARGEVVEARPSHRRPWSRRPGGPCSPCAPNAPRITASARRTAAIALQFIGLLAQCVMRIDDVVHADADSQVGKSGGILGDCRRAPRNRPGPC